ncbi:serine/threonine protein kinase [Kibdelosporangium banguiense]|uniref:non-specific serine/threonine protein kinase n=1 Tax=Kibdelosporangium banguiense TaxID=1365924 RepID=A0ABS4TSC0_9PSEU|nr:WD40 repeat domain-containing serine/threonine protein kinase [Kibdelosporangium banguiense]MBP2327298.1 serine/threonine protein kinase [Kibdelosporangium banguiense]
MEGSQATPRLVGNRYRLGTLSGSGGMGTVWQATDELIGRAVAVKELRPPAGLSADERALVSRRALREAQTAGRIHHPGVIAIHDIVPAGDDDDAIYIVMELVTAPTLADVLNQTGALPEDRVLTLGARILAALDAAHRLGVVHRDVKPGNIMVLPGDQVKLIDFGIAHAMDDTRLTRDGIMGSTGYMAPELFHGQDPAPASDLWSVGATLCHAIIGHGPFDRDSTAATLHAILYDELPPLPCQPPLATVITGLLTRDIDSRMTSRQAQDLLEPSEPAADSQDTQVVTPTRDANNATAVYTAKENTGVRRYLILGAITVLVIVGTILLIPVFTNNAQPTGPASPSSTTSAVRFQLTGSTMTTQTKLTHATVLSPDGRTLLTIVTDGPIRLWDVSDPAKAADLGTASASPHSAAFSADARTLAISDGNAVRLWNVTDPARPAPLGKPIPHPSGSSGFSAIALSADGRKLATADQSARIQLLDVSTPAGPATLATATADKPVDSMVFGADGRTLLTVTTSETVQLWDISEPTRVSALNRSLSASSGVKFTYAAVSPAGDTVATVGGDQAVQLWKVSDLANATPAPAAVLPPEPVFGGIRTEPLRFSPDGRSLGVANTKEGVQLWDLADSARPAVLGLLSRHDIPGERVDSAVLGPDRQTLITISYDNGVCLWRVSR